jgi:hypothetical protein
MRSRTQSGRSEVGEAVGSSVAVAAADASSGVLVAAVPEVEQAALRSPRATREIPRSVRGEVLIAYIIGSLTGL